MPGEFITIVRGQETSLQYTKTGLNLKKDKVRLELVAHDEG